MISRLLSWFGSRLSIGNNSTHVNSSSFSGGVSPWGWSGGWLGGVFGGGTAAGMPVNQETALTVSTVFACTQARAETLASLPPMVYLELGGGARRRHSDNSVWQLLHDMPNPQMDSMQFWELISTRMINRGNGFAEIVRDRSDRPVELWPIHNSRAEPELARDGTLQWRIYCDPSPESPLFDGRPGYRYYTIPDRDMLNVVGFGGNGVIGRGVIPVASEEIAANMAMTQFSASFFKNGARPAAVVSHPGYVDDEQKRRTVREDLNRAHSGRENWHQIPILWEGMTWKDIQASPEQAQLIETKKYGAKTICQFYKVPPSIVQIYDDFKFSSVDAMIQLFVMTCLRADAVRVERSVRRKITHTLDSRGRLTCLFDDPYVFEFVLEALLRGDAKKQAETLEIERRWGVTNADEWRSLNNREPLPNGLGQIYTVASGTEDLSRLGKTYEKDVGSTGDSHTENRKPKTENLASFDRPQFYKSLESGIPRHKNRSRGGSVADASTLRDEMDSAVTDVLREAVVRVETILEKEIAKAADDETKLAAAWEKHGRRLESALATAAGLYCRYRDVEPSSVLRETIEAIVAERIVLGGDVTGEIFKS